MQVYIPRSNLLHLLEPTHWKHITEITQALKGLGEDLVG